MRAIIIEEDRFNDVIALMKAAVAKIDSRYVDGFTDQQIQIVAEAAHRAMHYEFVKWAQSHGASCVRG